MGEEFQLSRYLREGFELFKKSPGLFVGFFVMAIIILVVCNIIPLIGQIANILINQTLFAGFFYVGDKLYKNENAELSDFFAGFQKIAAFIVYSLLMYTVVIALAIILVGTTIVPLIMNSESASVSGLSFLSVLLFAGLAISIYLLMIYVPCYILFHHHNAITAIKSSFNLVKTYFFEHLLMMLTFLGLFIISIIPLGLGLLVIVPVMFLTIYSAWKHLTRYEDDGMAVEDHII